MTELRDVELGVGSSIDSDNNRSESGTNRTTLASGNWRIWGQQLPKQEIVFFSQVFIIYVVIITCVVNLTLGRDEGKIWIALLSSCLGYLLPNPSLKAEQQKRK